VLLATPCTTADPSDTSAPTDSSGPVEIAIGVERSSEVTVGVDVYIAGRDFAETIHVSDEPMIIGVPGPGPYLFQVGGVIEESTGPTTGCWWYGEPTWVEITDSKTVDLRADQVCA
jgi:hypothetical protein